MKRCTSLVAFFLALGATAAQAQFTDNFTTPRFVPEWSFGENTPDVYYPSGHDIGTYDGSPGVNNENAKLYVTGNGAFTVTMGNGNQNQPSLTVAPNAPKSWDTYFSIQTAVGATPADAFTFIAGVEFSSSNNTYVQFVDKNYGSSTGPGYEYGATPVSINGSNPGSGYDYLSDYSNITPGTLIAYHIHKTSTSVTYSYTLPGGTEHITGTALQNDPDAGKAAIFNLLDNVSGLHITLYNNNYYSGKSPLVSFSNFSTTLPIVHPQANATDPFYGPQLNPVFTITNPDAQNYSVTKGLFLVHAGQGYNTNQIAATVKPGAPSDYDVEVAVNAPVDAVGLPINGADFGLKILTDNNNYVQLFSKAGANGGLSSYPDVYATINGSRVANYDNFVKYYPYVGDGPALYRIKKTGTSISFSVTKPGQAEYIMGTVSASDDITVNNGFNAPVYTFLSDLSNKQIQLFNNNSYTGNPANIYAAFSRFYTNAPLVNQPVTATGTVSLEGVNNLSAISAGAPLGTFHVSFRTPGTTTEVLGTDLALTSLGATGTYTVPGGPSGTYDVNVKGAKNLSATASSVNLAASPLVSLLTLGAGDANNDNVTDTSDFNILAGAFGAAFDPAQPNSVTGYEPTGDFNFDGVIDTSDFNLLVGEFGNAGY